MKTKLDRVYELTLQMLSDKKIHTTKEITMESIARGIVTDQEGATIRSILHQIRKNRGGIEMVSRGKYRLSDHSGRNALLKSINANDAIEGNNMDAVSIGELRKVDAIDIRSSSMEDIVWYRENITRIERVAKAVMALVRKGTVSVNE